eukprot:m.34364 g.34364  ORF g.34364 m.34364 type:complete len:381 (-) comp8713_c0_seq2:74-1216(-)
MGDPVNKEVEKIKSNEATPFASPTYSGSGSPQVPGMSPINPYADLPPPSQKVPPKDKAPKRKAENEVPEGWIKVPSKSRPGNFSYENKYTKERIGWLPDRPASKRRKELPPAPKVEKKPKPPKLEGEEKKIKDRESIELALEKLLTLLEKQEPEKFITLCKAVHKALFSSACKPPDVVDSTKNLILKVLAALQKDPKMVVTSENRRYVRKVFEKVIEHKDMYPKSRCYQLDTWIMRCVHHIYLYTDDSFQFNKAAKVFSEAVIEIDKNSKKTIIEEAGIDSDYGRTKEKIDDHLLEERKTVIVEVLHTLLAQARLPWAVASVNGVFTCITQRRHLFSEEQLVQIDECYEKLLKKKSTDSTRKDDHTGMMQGRVIARRRAF